MSSPTFDDESDPTLDSLTSARREELAREAARHRDYLSLPGHGSYDRYTSESELLTLTTTEARCVVHFAKEEFARCRTMDTALEQLAKRHVETRFVRLEATEAPWVVERLKVRVLPCVMGFVGGKSVARITGFEGLGGGREEQSGFSLGKLERKLVEYGVLEREMGMEGMVVNLERNRG